MAVTGTIRVTGPRSLGQVDGPGDDGEGRGLIRWTSGVLIEWTCVIVTTVVYDGTSGPCPRESRGNGGAPGFLIEWTVGSGVVLK